MALGFTVRVVAVYMLYITAVSIRPYVIYGTACSPTGKKLLGSVGRIDDCRWRGAVREGDEAGEEARVIGGRLSGESS